MKDEEVGRNLGRAVSHSCRVCAKAFGYSMSLKKRAEIQFSDCPSVMLNPSIGSALS